MKYPSPENNRRTFFATPWRTRPEKLKQAAKRVSADPVVKVVLESVLGYVLILDKNRQILAGNEELLTLLGLGERESILGHRPGEALGCIHAAEGPSGCGTSRNCKYCGAVLAILAALDSDLPSQGECHLSSSLNGRLRCAEFRVNATPLKIAGEDCLVFVLVDISGQKRREALERVFLHDLRNSVTGLLGWGDLLEAGSSQRAAKNMVMISREIGLVLEEHNFLMYAESGELCVSLAEVKEDEIFDMVLAALLPTGAAKGKKLKVERFPSGGRKLFTDLALVTRVLINMGKNALEATGEGGEVAMRLNFESARPVFYVHNDGFIPEEVQPRIFERAFSTKGSSGKGLGTYGMKLFGESYLGGEVGFTTSPEKGTDFYIKLQ